MKYTAAFNACSENGPNFDWSQPLWSFSVEIGFAFDLKAFVPYIEAHTQNPSPSWITRRRADKKQVLRGGAFFSLEQFAGPTAG